MITLKCPCCGQGIDVASSSLVPANCPQCGAAWPADPAEAIRAKVTGSPYSRFLVCDASLDNLLGVVQAKDLLWQGPDGPVESCCILTTTANELVRPVHDRMPVILPRQHWAAWLGPTVQEAGALLPLLRPYPAEAMTACPVGPWVNNPQNEGPACLAPPA